MIVMTPQASESEVEAVRERLAATGVHVVVMPGELTTAIGAIGDPEGVAELGLEGMSGVDRVVPISRPYKLAAATRSRSSPGRAPSNHASRRWRWRATWPRPAHACCAAAPTSPARPRSP